MTQGGGVAESGGEGRSRAGEAREKVQETTQQLQERAQPVVGQAKQKAQERAEQVRGQARTRISGELDTRSTQAGEQVQSLSQAVRSTAEQLRGQGQERPAKVAEQAAERAERLGGYLTESEGERILEDVQDFARRQPWLVAGAGALVGLLAARFLKVSGSGSDETARDGRAYEGIALTETDVLVARTAVPPTGTSATAPVSPLPPEPDAPLEGR